MKVKTFFHWALENQSCYKGMGIYDLIEDIKHDRAEFPRSGDYSVVKMYMERQHASGACMVAFEDAWADYWRGTRGQEWMLPDD